MPHMKTGQADDKRTKHTAECWQQRPIYKSSAVYVYKIFLTRSKIITKLPQNDASNIKMQRSHQAQPTNQILLLSYIYN